MIKIKLSRLLALLAIASMFGCAATTPSTSSADEEDEYEGRFLSWEFEIESDGPEPATQPSTTPTNGESTAGAESGTGHSRPTNQPRRVRYSAEDDEDGDRGFIIHSADDSDFDDD